MDSEEQTSTETKAEGFTEPKEVAPESNERIEKEQEAKLHSKYPGLRGPGSSAFLQKRIFKGQKYFDSGDYQMAKAHAGKTGQMKQMKQPTPLILPGPTGSTIPTPESVPHRKSSLIQSKLAAGQS
ncbi:Alpha-endosulfine [Lamellibrachia satsuma]|nr:Alpha-endosulfine [Lamellibrachia satsuma]